MGLKLSRTKATNYKLSILYRLAKFLPFSKIGKLKLFLDLAWIFNRLAHEQSILSEIEIKSNEDQDFISSFITKDATVLYIGCGTGYVINRILQKTENIVGVDHNMNSIIEAKKRFEKTNVQFHSDDVFVFMNNNKIANFDYIILSHVLEHIDNPQLFLSSVTKFAKFVYVEVPDYEADHLNLYRALLGTNLNYSDADHVSEFDRKEIKGIFANCNLSIVETEYRFGVMKFWCKKNDL